jgi:hypothetical protein
MVNPSNYRIESTISRRDAPGKRFLVQLSRRSLWFEGLTTNAAALTVHPEQLVEGFFEFTRESAFTVC